MSLLAQSDRIDERRLWTLLVTLIAIFLLYPLATALDVLRFYRLFLILALGQAAYSVSGILAVRRIAIALCVPAILGQIASTTGSEHPWVLLVGMGLLFAFLAFIAAILLQSVFRPGEVTGDRIAGAICLYLIFGMLWTILYGAILVGDPAAIHMSEAAHEAARQGGEMTLLYFSFVTLTTLGYGDITPISPLAQTAAWLQAVFGQLYLAILLARLVSLHVATRVSRDARRPSDSVD